MTLKELTDTVANRIRDTSSTTDTRIREFAQDVMDMILLHTNYPGQEREGIIRTVDGVSRYALRPDVARIIDPIRVIEDQQIVYPMTVVEWDLAWPKPTSTGTPFNYCLWEAAGVEKQPESKLRFVSDTAGDVRTVSIYGISGGVQKSETITLAGATGVLSTNTYSELTDLPEASATHATAVITATANSSSGDSNLPTVAAAGSVTVFTIAATATKPTTLMNPGSLVRIKMNTDDADDRGKVVIVEGYVLDTTNNRDRLFIRESITTDATNSTTFVNSTNRFTSIINISKAWNADQILYIRVDPVAAIVATIPSAVRTIRYPQISFYPIPTGQTIRYRYYAQQVRLGTVAGADAYQPPWDTRFDRIWLWHTERAVRAFKQNASPNMSTDPELLADIKLVLRNVGMRSNMRVTLGSGTNVEEAPLVMGRLKPSRYKN